MSTDKLVRDRIPEIMQAAGKRAITHVATEEEYERRLRDKLKEEATEFYVSGREEELADVLEVVYALCELKKIPMAKLEDVRKKKAAERGAFSKRIVLDGSK
jgi:predicted house-cleaning noncanonical NTP pyrophosphatase (MazG superfamily)